LAKQCPQQTTYSLRAAGGFCGAFSLQHNALAFGAWISQDLVRKANRDEPGEHHMHGDSTLGFEVMPSNVAYTARKLRLTYEEFDYSQATPQAASFKRWLKSQLSRGHPVVFFPMCAGDSHTPYPGSNPNGGHVDHVEPIWGLFSNHPLDDPNVYDDDWILHASDQDFMPYYRPLNSLDDSPAFQGNCKAAQPGFRLNEMYPCFDANVTYGLAVTGLAIQGETIPTVLSTDGAVQEPNVRIGEPAVGLAGWVMMSKLTKGAEYAVYRFDGVDTLPATTAELEVAKYTWRHVYKAAGEASTYPDPVDIPSDGAVYYVTVRRFD